MQKKEADKKSSPLLNDTCHTEMSVTLGKIIPSILNYLYSINVNYTVVFNKKIVERLCSRKWTFDKKKKVKKYLRLNECAKRI